MQDGQRNIAVKSIFAGVDLWKEQPKSSKTSFVLISLVFIIDLNVLLYNYISDT